jgi:STE24 endopeptidase
MLPFLNTPSLLILVAAATCAWAAWTLYLDWRQADHVARHRGAVPRDFAALVTPEQHRKAADYSIAKLRLGAVQELVSLAVSLALLFWGFDALAGLTIGVAAPWRDVAFVACAVAVSQAVAVPFEAYGDFVIETRFGFNRKTPALFAADLLKRCLISAVIGLPLLVLLFWVMDHVSGLWWLYAWAGLVALMIVVPPIYVTLIAPLFNKFSPLSDASLRQRIEGLMERCGFHAAGLFVMDASRRSGHGNAYFTGFGRTKRIVLFDTLIASQDPLEIEAVLAHELGHFKHRHVLFGLLRNAAYLFLVLAIVGWLCRQPWLTSGFGFTHDTDGLRIIAATLIFGIVSPLFSIVFNGISRRNEFQADDFARRNVGADPMVSALTKLSRDNASTLTPDPLYALVHYSHPPVPVRVAQLRIS